MPSAFSLPTPVWKQQRSRESQPRQHLLADSGKKLQTVPMNQEQILDVLSEHLPEFRRLGVRRIGLLGSYASGSEGKGSDIDILVEFDGGRKTFDTYMDLKFRLEELFDGRSVDLVVKDALKPTVRPHVLADVRYVS
jgi:uncharacterized protein